MRATTSRSTIESRPPDTATTSGAPRATSPRTASITRAVAATLVTRRFSVERVGLALATIARYICDSHFAQRHAVETHGPLAVIWVALGLIAFYIALIWINSLLGLFLTPLFIIPLTWFQDRMRKRRERKAQ